MSLRHSLGFTLSYPRLLPASFLTVHALCLFTGCATALNRESRCLASLTVDVVQAHEEIAELETAWRESLIRRDVAFHSMGPPSSPPGRTLYMQSAKSALPTHRSWEGRAPEYAIVEEARLAARQSYDLLAEAKTRHQPLLAMYDKIYQRVRTRTEEETILSDVRMFMLAGPASFVFYPIIRWNVRTVLWGDGDPDAASDPIGSFCINQLQQPGQREPAAGPGPSEADPSVHQLRTSRGLPSS